MRITRTALARDTAILLIILVVVVLAPALAGCRGSSLPSTPSAAPPVPRPATPSEPFQVKGVIVDTAERVIAGATVEVLDGPQIALATTSDASGAFSLTGVFDGRTRFRASKDGYIAATYTFPSIVTTKRLGFGLGLLAAPVNIAGDYTVTFMADSACADFPIDVRTRTYPARVAARDAPYSAPNTQFAATLSGAGLDAYYKQISIGVAGDYLTFDLSDNYVLDEVAPGAYLAIGGYGHASVATSGVATITGTIQGPFDYCVVTSDIDGEHYHCPEDAVAHSQCQSTNHQLILVRR
jgi:hypothetical protein